MLPFSNFRFPAQIGQNAVICAEGIADFYSKRVLQFCGECAIIYWCLEARKIKYGVFFVQPPLKNKEFFYA